MFLEVMSGRSSDNVCFDGTPMAVAVVRGEKCGLATRGVVGLLAATFKLRAAAAEVAPPPHKPRRKCLDQATVCGQTCDEGC